MSKLKVQQPIAPVIHVPSYKQWGIQRYYLVEKLKKLGIEPFPKDVDFILNQWYFYTNLEGWGKILYDLAFSSRLYKKDIFACDAYAFKAQTVCAERYDLNSLRMCIGSVPGAKHGFDLFFYGDQTGVEGIMLWEPNDGFECSGEAFEIGEYGYRPELVLI